MEEVSTISQTAVHNVTDPAKSPYLADATFGQRGRHISCILPDGHDITRYVQEARITWDNHGAPVCEIVIHAKMTPHEACAFPIGGGQSTAKAARQIRERMDLKLDPKGT